jgi:quercetin dioxygenase-like cupin family protein
MGRAGDVYEMPDGAQYILRTPGAEVDGEYVEFEWLFPAGVFAPPPHIHPGQVEEYEVLDGEFEVLVGEKWTTLREGESASVPVGVNHTFRSPERPVHIRNFHRPALGFEEFIERMHATVTAAKLRPRDPRLPLYLAQVWRDYPETLQASRTRERVGMSAAAALGRLLRMKPA